jgi:hypothetical protein
MNKRVNIILDDEEDFEYEEYEYDYEDDAFDIPYESAMEP